MGFVMFSQTLHIYGGQNNKTYLGCLTCNNNNGKSIWNEYGRYGSKYNGNSIWSFKSKFGNKFNKYSPWNRNSNSPPVILDNQGKFYGYLTINRNKKDRATFKMANQAYDYYNLLQK
jgi:hypothetical protein